MSSAPEHRDRPGDIINMYILGIETSCDDTAASVLEIKSNKAKILSDVVLSQTAEHAVYGGIVPQMAAKMHSEAITKVIKKAMDGSKLPFGKLDFISVTRGPGLIVTLLVGVASAKTLSFVFGHPMVGVNHLEGHIYASELVKNKAARINNMKFPALCLLVSGGHTMLVLMEDYLNYKILGETRDDAAGEAFDKVARLLNLGYPGGPIIEKMSLKGDSSKYDFPRAMIKTKDYDFSLSGLKTAVLREVYNDKTVLDNEQSKRDMCASFQMAAFEPLVAKFMRAAEEFGAKTLVLGGGVAANKTLQRLCKKAILKNLRRSTVFRVPKSGFTSDNASMIALAGYYHLKKNHVDNWQNIEASADLSF